MQKLVLLTFELCINFNIENMFQIVDFQKSLEGQCLIKNRLTAPINILLGVYAIITFKVVPE